MNEELWTVTVGAKRAQRKPGRKFGLIGRQPTFSHHFNNRSRRHELEISNKFDVEMLAAEDKRSMRSNSFDASLTEQEIEERYNAISLSVRTESLTLKHRLEHQLRQRDIVECNMKKEVEIFQSFLSVMKQQVVKGLLANYGRHCESGHYHEMFVQIEHQLDAVHNSALRISSAAETLGAVEYESRLSAAVELLILYVDMIKRKWEKEHRELEETKRILKESGVNIAQCLAELPDLRKSKNCTSTVTPTKRRASFPASPLRRISLAASPPPPPSAHKLQSKNACIVLADRKIDAIAEEKDETQLKDESDNQVTNQRLQQVVHVEASKSAMIGQEKSAGNLLTKATKGPNKSRSWTSLNSVDKSTSQDEPSDRRIIFSVSLMLTWLKMSNHWCRLKHDQFQKRVRQWRQQARLILNRQKWDTHQLLLIARYTTATGFLLAALFSLVMTFVPSTLYYSQSVQQF